MKTKHLQIILGIATVYALPISSQARQFQNLDFESSLGSPVFGNSFFNLPGWTVTTVGDPYSAFPGGVFDSKFYSLGGAYGYIIPIYGFDIMAGTTIDPLGGNQSVALYTTASPGPAAISISQTGTIPTGQNSVSFLLGYFETYGLTTPQNPLSVFSLSINSQNVPLAVTLANGQVLTVAGNISQWAGQTVSLAVTETVGAGYNNEAFGVIDNVAFSPVAVPESARIGLFAATLSLSVVFLKKRKPFQI